MKKAIWEKKEKLFDKRDRERKNIYQVETKIENDKHWLEEGKEGNVGT